jgi:hypothetical protein
MLSSAAFAAAIFSAASCRSAAKPSAVPRAELIVVTADSTYWITSAPQGLRIRGVPMLLARVDGRFREIYVSDDDRSFYNAVLVGQRLWSRDLIRGDSVELFADTLVPRYALTYAKAHPDEAPLLKDEETADRPRTSVTADLEVLGVHGPYISFEYRTDMDMTGERNNADRHTARRGVIDLRTGKAVTVATLFGREAAQRVEGDANTEWRTARDSLLALRDRRSRRAQRAIASFAFDPTSFTIQSRDGEPRVAYAVPGEVSRGSLTAIELEARAVPPTSWWNDIRGELPTGPDSLLKWHSDGMELSAELGEVGDVAVLTLRDASKRDWHVASVGAPVWRVHWLNSGVSAEDRKALKRAFNAASLYSDDAHIVMAPRRVQSRAGFVLAAYYSR